jgi:hypothetical protein
MIKEPKQLEPSASLVRSWAINRPKFYSLVLTADIVQQLSDTESMLARGVTGGLKPELCRALAAYHGPKGSKVPLSLATISGCVRPKFVTMNPWLSPASMSCYDGGCYLYHARAVPAKKTRETKVRAHTTPRHGLMAAAAVARRYSLPIRDNQSSDGSLSMGLTARGAESSQLFLNLLALNEEGYDDVPYLCFSSSYIRVADEVLTALSRFKNLIVHVTVSGWHSREENILRLREFERYSAAGLNTFLRVVNRQDWAMVGEGIHDSGARVERWLLCEIELRGFSRQVIRTPFHSVHPFPGGRPGSLGTRHMAGTDYPSPWGRLLEQGARECCTTGKCKTCPTRCGTAGTTTHPEPLLAARAFEGMLLFELSRQGANCNQPLAAYTARLLARKGAELYAEVGDRSAKDRLLGTHTKYEHVVRSLPLSTTQRRRLVNDSHALVMDGLDRHRLWASVATR